MRTGIDLIAKERSEQIKKHGRTIQNDAKENGYEELRHGAIALLENNKDGFPDIWDEAVCKKMLSKDYKGRLITAAALIAAEIDRIQNQ